MAHKSLPNESSLSSRATIAIVNLNLAIDGDSTYFLIVKNRDDLTNALERIASDARVENCLFAGEVIWIPGDRNEDNLTQEDVYTSYPNLLLI